ncbi:unnamed protein product, partial [Iphiclides podalirius]
MRAELARSCVYMLQWRSVKELGLINFRRELNSARSPAAGATTMADFESANCELHPRMERAFDVRRFGAARTVDDNEVPKIGGTAVFASQRGYPAFTMGYGAGGGGGGGDRGVGAKCRRGTRPMHRDIAQPSREAVQV